MIPARYLVAGVLVIFAWKGAALDIEWPRPQQVSTRFEKPSDEQLAWAEPLRAVLPKMLPQDREYLSSFYDAMKFVMTQDGGRSEPIVSDTDKFVAFHSGSLRLAIEKSNVGKYHGLDSAIDQVFFNGCGADHRTIDPALRQKINDVCGVLAYVLQVNGE